MLPYKLKFIKCVQYLDSLTSATHPLNSHQVSTYSPIKYVTISYSYLAGFWVLNHLTVMAVYSVTNLGNPF